MPADFGLDFRAFKQGFFDTAAVEKKLESGQRKVLSKFGAFVRRRARSSLRKRKAIASPGNPPSVHTSDSFRSLRNILFAYDSQSQSVVIGPVRFQVNTAAPLQEYGGETKIGIKKRVIHIRPHPFMNPAFEAERQESLPAMFANLF